jgi:sensor histidine kinase regulating citrate/malate metabolism
LLGEVYHDPRDALAEFVTNAADANASKIQVFLKRHAKEPCIQISDNGGGMAHDDLKYVTENIGKSLKRFDPKTAGEKGIGILGFQKFAEQCDIVSSSNACEETLCLYLRIGTLGYQITRRAEFHGLSPWVNE